MAGNDPSLVESNQKAIKTAAALAAATEAKSASARYFIQPASGLNWGILHDHNAVDIANSCGTPVKAAASGLVINDPDLGPGTAGWNGGYGDFVLIQHLNGTKTRYAHLSKIEVAVGTHVSQGDEIGLIGNTGHVQGETGCHLHFEVIGAPNPFAKS